MAKTTDFGGYQITERQLDNGWYELSTMATSMGETYRESKRYDHKPNNTDYRKFVQSVHNYI